MSYMGNIFREEGKLATPMIAADPEARENQSSAKTWSYRTSFYSGIRRGFIARIIP